MTDSQHYQERTLSPEDRTTTHLHQSAGLVKLPGGCYLGVEVKGTNPPMDGAKWSVVAPWETGLEGTRARAVYAGSKEIQSRKAAMTLKDQAPKHCRLEHLECSGE